MKIISFFPTHFLTRLLFASLFAFATPAIAATPQDSLLTFVHTTKEELRLLQQLAEQQQHEVRLAITHLDEQLRQKEQLGQFDAQYLQLLAMKFQFKDNLETGFLRQYNTTLKEECTTLFEEYTKVLGYNTPLDRCRKSDDWDKVIELLDAYIEEMDVTIKKTPNDKGVYKKQVNLDFSVDRLLDYINKYTLFVSQGEKYYQKFKGIVNSYENEAKCANQLPKQFSDLKKDIDNSIEKFNTSYNLAELKGSKMKDLLYGRSEGE